MEKFRVALSGDFRKADGTPAFPSFDLTPLDQDQRVDWSFIPVRDGHIHADDLKGFDALILLGANFDKESIPGDGQLTLVARFGVGFDSVDVPACTEQNVAVVITPDGVRRPVAVAILTYVLALSGRLLIKDRMTRAGPDGWAQRGAHMGNGIVGLTLGSVGVGNIGAEMFRLAEPFGMQFIAHDPYADPEVADELNIELVSLEEVFRRSDFVTVNCPLNAETEGLVNADRLALMKPTSFLINTARGPIVDQAALTKALSEKAIAGAGLDVFEDEPSDKNDPIFALDNVIVTPHALCWTDQCFAGIGAADIKAVFDTMLGKPPRGIVNREIVDDPKWQTKLSAYGRRHNDG